jgi:hypothetical protein
MGNVKQNIKKLKTTAMGLVVFVATIYCITKPEIATPIWPHAAAAFFISCILILSPDSVPELIEDVRNFFKKKSNE